MFTLAPLPYDYPALEPWIDTETMKIHHDKHHQAYVDNLNKTLEGHEDLAKMHGSELLVNLDKVPEEIRMKVRNNLGGVVNHNFFWQIMSPNPEGARRLGQGKSAEAINKSFGSLEDFQKKFTDAGLGRFGSGWAWLVVEDEGKLKIMDTPNQDSPLTTGLEPVLCLDVWEHAYYLKYQNRRADYIKAWWNVVNWEYVEKRYQEALK